MKPAQTIFFFVAAAVLAGAFFTGLKFRTSVLAREKGGRTEMNARVRKLEELAPDIGDMMREFQMEMAKLWYAEKFRNRPLAEYEIKEIDESIDAVDVMKPKVNGIDAAAVLDALRNAQIAGMKKAVRAGNKKDFEKQYKLTLTSCNQCHRAAGVGFNRITVPNFPPVPNQSWR